MIGGPLSIFALQSTRDFGAKVVEALAVPLSPHEEREFADGEHKSRPLGSVRGRDVFVIQSLYADWVQSVNDKLCRLLFFVGALHDAGAARITAVLPYLCYSRADRRFDPRGPVTTRYVAQLLESVGINAVVTLDVHNLSAYQNSFRSRNEHLEARPLFIEHLVPRIRESEVSVVSPDTGGIKRAERFRRGLESVLQRSVGLVYMEKRREHELLSGRLMIGDLRDRKAVIVDDMITTGKTLVRAARGCREAGATAVYAAATHGLFVGEAEDLRTAHIDEIVVTDTVQIQIERQELASHLTVLSAAPLVAEAIRRIHNDESVVELTE